jgi:MATE family multidrug resistance protein
LTTLGALPAVPQSITRQLFRLALPIIGLNVLNVLMLAVDAALCGRLPNSEQALAALGFALQVIFLLMVAMLGLLVGTVALVARAYGGGDTTRLEHLLVQATQLTILVGVAVGVAGALAARHILLVLGATPEVAALGADYLRPLMLGTPFFYLSLLYAGILRGVGNTKLPFLCALGANVVNAVLNYGLILGNLGMPAWGVAGSAIGTVIAQFVNVVALVIILRRGAVPNLTLPLKVRKIDRGLAFELYKIGWPAALDMLVLNAGFLTAIGMLGRIDQVTVAAHGLGIRVQSLAFVPGLGIAQATAAMIGQALGAGDAERARSIARAAVGMCVAFMTAIAIVILFAAHPLVYIFDVAPGSALERESVEWMYILALAMPPAAINMAMIGVLQGAGATRTSLRINIWTTIAIQVPLSILLGFGLGLDETGVWLAFPLAFVAKSSLNYLAYRQGKWAVTGVKLEKAL